MIKSSRSLLRALIIAIFLGIFWLIAIGIYNYVPEKFPRWTLRNSPFMRPVLIAGGNSGRDRFSAEGAFEDHVRYWGTERVPDLIEYIEDVDTRCSVSAIVALGILGDKRACSPLRNYMNKNPPVWTREEIIRSLGLIECREAAQEIYDSAIGDDRLKLVSAKSLFKLADHRGIDLYSELYEEGERDARLAVLGSLYDLRGPEIVNLLILAVRDKDDVVRARSLDALSVQPDARVAKYILNGLKDSSLVVSAEAENILKSKSLPSEIVNELKKSTDLPQ